MSREWRIIAVFENGVTEVLADRLSYDEAARLERSIVPLEFSLMVEHLSVAALAEPFRSGDPDAIALYEWHAGVRTPVSETRHDRPCRHTRRSERAGALSLSGTDLAVRQDRDGSPSS